MSWGGEWRGREGRQAARGNIAKQSTANANHTAAGRQQGPSPGLLNAVLAGRQAGGRAGRQPGQQGCLTLQVLSQKQAFPLQYVTLSVLSPRQ